MSEDPSALLSQLKRLYGTLESEVSLFVGSPRRQAVGCPAGCGLCCHGFEPEVLPLEAQLVAELLIQEGRTLPLPGENLPPGTCVFFNPASPFHCTVYAARPLVCRTFGFSTTKDKTGRPSFTFCRHMPTDGERRLSSSRITEIFSASPPSMGEYGSALSSLSPQAETKPLAAAVSLEMNLAEWKRRLSAAQDPPITS